jgi:hypothetical protein
MGQYEAEDVERKKEKPPTPNAPAPAPCIPCICICIAICLAVRLVTRVVRGACADEVALFFLLLLVLAFPFLLVAFVLEFLCVSLGERREAEDGDEDGDEDEEERG